MAEASPGNQQKQHCMLPPCETANVKSTAVVKYCAVDTPAPYAELESNTDLNLPPANWLRAVHGHQGLNCHGTLGTTNTSVFTSFQMAHRFPDCIGEVDVVSDAENIKKLLKIPYSKSQVSMLIHRIGNTILVDEFDIHRYLLRTAEKEWEWLRKFYLEHVLKSLHLKEKGFPRKNKSRYHLQHKSMFSKFLYYSIADVEDDDGSENSYFPPETPVSLSPKIQSLPDRTHEEEDECQYSGNHKFLRNVLWNFEDITMLIGTDMPIFGGGTHPCVSLRLRDKNKPISILTGLDYWLDNLMCNVPEVVMCYHLDGIVQKYELLKTEDIPQLDNSKFSTKVIKDVAQNILSFLKTNATKAGHTYWLFKGKDDDVVKLYDLTTLCADSIMEDKELNPFSVPVAMLLYTVARNMYGLQPTSRKRQSTILLLLKNCIKLLDESKHPQVVSSAYYLLADLYIPHVKACDTTNEDEDDCEEEEVLSEKSSSPVKTSRDSLDKCLLQFSSSVDVEALCLSQKAGRRDEGSSGTEAIVADLEERCHVALDHIIKGLMCIDHNRDQVENSQESPHQGPQQEENPIMAKPFHAIPLKYAPLTATQDLTSCNQKPCLANNLQTTGTTKPAMCGKPNQKCWMIRQHHWSCPMSSIPWHASHKLHLIEKAAVALYLLAENSYTQQKYGVALQHLRMADWCLESVQMLLSTYSLNFEDTHGLVRSCLGLAGDVHYMMAKTSNQFVAYLEEYDSTAEAWNLLARSLQREVQDTNCECLVSVDRTADEHFILSTASYQAALATIDTSSLDKQKLHRRLGNTYNDMAVMYMQRAETLYSTTNAVTENVRKLWQQSIESFHCGIDAFHQAGDSVNHALLNSNLGRLMRLCAHCEAPETDERCKEFTSLERRYYQKAFHSYEEALCALSRRDCSPEIWDSVSWEFSTALFTMATLLQDYAPLSTRAQEDVEKEIAELLVRALSHCDIVTPGCRQLICQYRAGTIHHRLASLYHHAIRNQVVENAAKLKEFQQLAETHYREASSLFQAVEHPPEFLRVQLEHVGMHEHFLQNKTGFTQRLKILLHILDIILGMQRVIATLIPEKLGESSCGEVNSTPQTATVQEDPAEALEVKKLLSILLQRLQAVLLSLIKLHSMKKGQSIAALNYKKMYGIALSASVDSVSKFPSANSIYNTVGEINTLHQQASCSESSR